MKKALIICLIVLLVVGCFALVACSKKTVTITAEPKKGAIGAFSAITPTNGVTVEKIPAFSWTEATNADTYTLEIASTDAFEVADEYYVIKTGITSTTFNLLAELKKDKTYYWRVTAKNDNSSTLITGDCLSFYYQATLSDEIPISIGYADEWKVHEVGSKATVTLDHSSFFAEKGNAAEMAAKKESLRVSFDSEDTQRGSKYVESNGWVVVTRSLETEFYGTDAFYFNFYYSGNDATAYFRLIDEDNEYWYAPIKLAVNAKQTIIMRLEDFTLRTKGTPVMNETFDYHYIKSMELVFERVDGDGVAYFGNLKAIKYSNYTDLFIESVDFKQLTEAKPLVNDSVYFNFTNTVSDDGSSLTYAFTTNNDVPNAQKGYGFVKMDVEKILISGDAFSFNVNIGVETKEFNFLLRVIEEDNDVWFFKIYAKDIPNDGKLLVPFSAFLLAEGGFKGDGIRQFYKIKQLQFGVNSLYQSGQITISDFDIVSLKDNVTDLYKRTVSDSGLIEDFETYSTVVDVYYKWETSTANKDEAISLYNEPAISAKNHAAKLYYKTDLPEAEYKVNFDSVDGYTAIEIYAKDVFSGSSTRGTKMMVYLYGGPNELYSYKVDKLDKEWTCYTIPISKFTITENSFGSQHIACENITGISLAFSYSYSGTPKYNSGNYVCVDNIRFANATEYSKKEVSVKIKMANSNYAIISDFDADTEDTLKWTSDSGASYISLALADETASGEGKSLKMGYKTKMEAAYYVSMAVDSSVRAKGLTFKMKGDAYNSKAVIVIYVSANNQTYKFQKEVTGISTDWTTYSIGFNAFTKTEGDDSFTWSDSQAKCITEVLINYKNYDAAGYYASQIYLDDVILDNTITLSTDTRATI